MSTFHSDIWTSITKAVTEHLRLSGKQVRFYPLVGDVGEALWWRQFLKALFESDVFQSKHLRDAVFQGVRTCGLEMYDQVVGGRYPDHVASPEALAFVLQSGAITSDQAKYIRFDHGETLEQFKTRADGLIDDILRQLENL